MIWQLPLLYKKYTITFFVKEFSSTLTTLQINTFKKPWPTFYLTQTYAQTFKLSNNSIDINSDRTFNNFRFWFDYQIFYATIYDNFFSRIFLLYRKNASKQPLYFSLVRKYDRKFLLNKKSVFIFTVFLNLPVDFVVKLSWRKG